MNQLLRMYMGVGKSAQASLAKKHPCLILGAHPPIGQTPGRLQYYKAENEPFIPDSVKWQIRLPTRFAFARVNLRYEEQIQDEINNFISNHIKHDYLDSQRELNLNLTLREAEYLFSANDEVKQMAESGDLQKLHESCAELNTAVTSGFVQVMDKLDRLLQQVRDAESDIYETLNSDYGVERCRRHTVSHEQSGFEGIFSVRASEKAHENYILARGAANEAHGNKREDLEGIVHQLEDLLQSRASIFDAKVKLCEEFSEKIDNEDAALKEDLVSFKKSQDLFSNAAHRAGSEESVYSQSVQQLRDGDLKDLLDKINDHSKVFGERAAIYDNYLKVNGEPSEALDKFRTELLQHLAGTIVIGEHKMRYQKEQFDRFHYTRQCSSLKRMDEPLRNFAKYYAQLIELYIDVSHGYRCPKIEANYDDFGEKTLRPLNATIFYYFFSANRSGKMFAQWMLSAARYPNEKVRRAYMRFFN